MAVAINSLTIKTKFSIIGVSIVLASVGLLSIGGYASQSFFKIEEATILTSEVKNEMLTLRLSEKDYLAKNSSNNQVKFVNRYEKLDKSVTQLTGQFKSLGIKTEKISELRNLLKDYSNKFNRIVVQQKTIELNQDNGLLADMRKTILQADNILTSVVENVSRQREKRLSNIVVTAISSTFLMATIILGFIIILMRSILVSINNLSTVMFNVESNNDLSIRSENTSNDEVGKMSVAFNKMLEKFEALVQQIQSSSSQLATASEEVSSVAQEGANHILRQRTETDMVATAMNEMSATVKEVAVSAESAAGAANNANNDALSGRAVVNDTAQAIAQLAIDVTTASKVIHKLESDSDEIGSILDVIKNIAEQTNLLALNAAIEAARAGEQGRGFAVVADEVRTLASRTQASTFEIEEKISKLQNGSKQAVEVMDKGSEQARKGEAQAREASDSLEAITRAVSTINTMNTQIASAAEQQSATAEEMNRNIVNISEVSELTARGSEQTTSASNELAKLASDLQRLVGQFKIN